MESKKNIVKKRFDDDLTKGMLDGSLFYSSVSCRQSLPAPTWFLYFLPSFSPTATLNSYILRSNNKSPNAKWNFIANYLFYSDLIEWKQRNYKTNKQKLIAINTSNLIKRTERTKRDEHVSRSAGDDGDKGSNSMTAIYAVMGDAILAIDRMSCGYADWTHLITTMVYIWFQFNGH